MTPAELTGRSRGHIVELADPPCTLHAQAAAPFLSMRRAAAADGFDLVAASSFRDFERQLGIWNAKYSGAAPMVDAAERPLEAVSLPPAQRVAAILLWSALPGASRHHWGTDVDLIDRNAMAGQRVRLTAAEFQPATQTSPAGPFAPLAAWLEANAARYGFFRPFRGVLSGVQAEPWHCSFAPLAEPARARLSVGVLRDCLETAPLLGREHVLDQLEALHQRYVSAIDWP